MAVPFYSESEKNANAARALRLTGMGVINAAPRRGLAEGYRAACRETARLMGMQTEAIMAFRNESDGNPRLLDKPLCNARSVAVWMLDMALSQSNPDAVAAISGCSKTHVYTVRGKIRTAMHTDKTGRIKDDLLEAVLVVTQSLGPYMAARP
jgi:hypothetical protein